MRGNSLGRRPQPSCMRRERVGLLVGRPRSSACDPSAVRPRKPEQNLVWDRRHVVVDLLLAPAGSVEDP